MQEAELEAKGVTQNFLLHMGMRNFCAGIYENLPSSGVTREEGGAHVPGGNFKRVRNKGFSMSSA